MRGMSLEQLQLRQIGHGTSGLGVSSRFCVQGVLLTFLEVGFFLGTHGMGQCCSTDCGGQRTAVLRSGRSDVGGLAVEFFAGFAKLD